MIATVAAKTRRTRHHNGVGFFFSGLFITIYHATEKAVYKDKYYVFG